MHLIQQRHQDVARFVFHCLLHSLLQITNEIPNDDDDDIEQDENTSADDVRRRSAFKAQEFIQRQMENQTSLQQLLRDIAERERTLEKHTNTAHDEAMRVTFEVVIAANYALLLFCCRNKFIRCMIK